MKGYKDIVSRNYAVSEVVGGIMLVLIAVVAFSAIYVYLLPPAPVTKTFVTIVGDVNSEGRIVLYHEGGQPLTDYKIIVRNYPNGTLVGSGEIKDDYWKINTYRYPLELININNIKLINATDRMEIEIYNTNKDGSQEQIFSGILNGKSPFSLPRTLNEEFMLISSLRTNTTSEDLICFADNVNSSINASTYIYSWMIYTENQQEGYPFAQFLMPFNTNSSTTTRDYSVNNFNATVQNCEWIENGIIGGAYKFGGSKNYIFQTGLPRLFDDLYRNSFTISLWVSCAEMDRDNKIILEIRQDTQNFIRLFQEDNAYHFGVSVAGTKYSVKSENALSDVWYHLAAVWNPNYNYLAVYINGTKLTYPGSQTFSYGSHTGISIGHGAAGSGGYWNGYIDEIQIYDRVLSDEQICQIYLTQKTGSTSKEVIVSPETQEGEIWQCIVYPNDGTQDGDPIISNSLKIIEYGERD